MLNARLSLLQAKCIEQKRSLFMACHGKYPILKAEIIPNFIQKKIQFIQHVIYSYKQYKHSLFCFYLYLNSSNHLSA